MTGGIWRAWGNPNVDLPPRFVYFAVSESAPWRIKIGISIDPKTRLRTLRAKPLLLIESDWSNSQRIERALHERFAVSRLEGEWFGYSADMAEFIAERKAAS